MTEQLRTGSADGSVSAQIGAMAEQLSATIQELSTAAAQIMAAVAQISRGAQMQAAATQQSSAALAQIERGAGVARNNAEPGDGTGPELATRVEQGKAEVERLVAGVGQALTEASGSLEQIVGLETMGRRIELSGRWHRSDRGQDQHAGGQWRG